VEPWGKTRELGATNDPGMSVEAAPPPVTAPAGPDRKKKEPLVTLSASELAGLTKKLNRKHKALEPDAGDRGGYSNKKRYFLDSDEEDELTDHPDYIHTTEHDPSEWGGWQRLIPHTVPMKVMESFAAENYVVKGKIAASSPSTLWQQAPEAAAMTLQKDLSPEEVQQYKDAWETTQFLADQPAWPQVTVRHHRQVVCLLCMRRSLPLLL